MVLHSLDKNEATNLVALDATWVDTTAEVGAKSGEMSVVKLYEQAAGTLFGD